MPVEVSRKRALASSIERSEQIQKQAHHYDKAEKACEDMKIYPILEGSNLSEIDLGYNAFSLEKVIGLCFRFFSDPNAAVRLSDFYNDDKEYIDDKEHLEEDYIMHMRLLRKGRRWRSRWKRV